MASRSSNRAAVPEAKGALDKFKYEVASELGVPLSDGYNGDLTSRQNGSVGGYMVKKMIALPTELFQHSYCFCSHELYYIKFLNKSNSFLKKLHFKINIKNRY